MDRNEQFVREHWASMGPMIVGRFDICDMNGEMNWQAAREFTEQRLEEIRQVEEEIKLLIEQVRHEWALQSLSPDDGAQQLYIVRALRFGRILVREQAASLALKQGMK
jgi:hypothetical protein